MGAAPPAPLEDGHEELEGEELAEVWWLWLLAAEPRSGGVLGWLDGLLGERGRMDEESEEEVEAGRGGGGK